MLLRSEGDDATICIGQPAHAWLSGQIARAWGNDALPPPQPREQVCLAAEQHDAGMADWDAAPELNPDTGLPQSFMEMALATHLRLWTHAPQRVLPQSRYAAVLVSMHGTALYEMRDLDRMAPDDAAAVRRYLDSQRALQERLADGLDRDELRRNQKLLWAWDFLSLALCLRWEGRSVSGVPARDGATGIAVSGNSFDPWPFSDDTVTLRTEGRRLVGRFESDAALHAALERAPWVELEFVLNAP
jgi:hypothetical protein